MSEQSGPFSIQKMKGFSSNSPRKFNRTLRKTGDDKFLGWQFFRTKLPEKFFQLPTSISPAIIHICTLASNIVDTDIDFRPPFLRTTVSETPARAIPVSLYRGQTGKSGNDMFGIKKSPFWGPSWNHFSGLFGAFNCLPQY